MIHPSVEADEHPEDNLGLVGIQVHPQVKISVASSEWMPFLAKRPHFNNPSSISM